MLRFKRYEQSGSLSNRRDRRLPGRPAFILRNTIQVGNRPKRGFAFVPCGLNGQGPGVNLLGRGVEPRASTASQRPGVRLGEGWIGEVWSLFCRSAKLHAGIVAPPPQGGKSGGSRAPARPPETDGPSYC